MPSGLTEFGKYLKKNEIPASAVAHDLATTRAYIHMLATGAATPALRLAGEIEKWSKGEVKMQSWLKWVA